MISKKGYHSGMSGTETTFQKCASSDDEVQHTAAWYRQIREANSGYTACVVFRKNAKREKCSKALAQREYQIHESTGDTLPFATMHRIKDLNSTIFISLTAIPAAFPACLWNDNPPSTVEFTSQPPEVRTR